MNIIKLSEIANLLNNRRNRGGARGAKATLLSDAINCIKRSILSNRKFKHSNRIVKIPRTIKE